MQFIKWLPDRRLSIGYIIEKYRIPMNENLNEKFVNKYKNNAASIVNHGNFITVYKDFVVKGRHTFQGLKNAINERKIDKNLMIQVKTIHPDTPRERVEVYQAIDNAGLGVNGRNLETKSNLPGAVSLFKPSYNAIKDNIYLTEGQKNRIAKYIGAMANEMKTTKSYDMPNRAADYYKTRSSDSGAKNAVIELKPSVDLEGSQLQSRIFEANKIIERLIASIAIKTGVSAKAAKKTLGKNTVPMMLILFAQAINGKLSANFVDKVAKKFAKNEVDIKLELTKFPNSPSESENKVLFMLGMY